MKLPLLLIDFQAEFLERKGLRPGAGETVDRAAFLLRSWRDAAQPVLHIRLTVPAGTAAPFRHWREGAPPRCVEGTAGHAPPAQLRELPGETVLHKAGYGAPDLARIVHELGAEAVVVSGLLLHACVRAAVLDLLPLGLRILVAEDATASDDPIHASVTRRYLEDRAVEFASAARLAASLKTGCLPDFEAPSPLSLGAEVRTASAFAPLWSRLDFAERASLVERFAALLSSEIDSLARLIAIETAKPIRFARAELERSVVMAGAIARRLAPSQGPDSFEGGSLRRRPHGVVAVVTPWNNPVYLPLGKILPAVLCGNAAVWKPAPEADALARALVSLFGRSGWPEPLVRLVSGGARTGRALLSHPGIDAATLTASDAAGFSATEVCGRRRIPLQAELGGNNAAIIWPDADLEDAAAKVAAGAFELSGQRCTANRRAIVHRDVLEEFSSLLRKATGRLRAGSPLDPEADLGPMVSAMHRERVAGMLRRAGSDGLESTCLSPEPSPASPRESWESHPAWHSPTLIHSDDPGHEIVQEESFGPVLVLQQAGDWEEALALCNGVRQGLAASLFTRDALRVGSFLSEARAGILKVNASTADAAVDIPFGGWKASGIGPPEHGDGDLEFYTRIQTVYS